MVTLLHLLVFAVCLVECAASARNPRGNATRIIILAGLGIIHGLVPAVTPRSMMWAYASDDSVRLAAVLSLLGVICFAGGWRLYERGRPDWPGLSPGLQRWVESARGQRSLKRLFWACMAVSSAAWLLGLVMTAGSIRGAFEAARFAYRYADNMYLNVVLTHLTNTAAVPVFVSVFLSRRHRFLGAAFAVGMAALLFLASQGGRTASMSLLGTLVVAYMLRYRWAPRRIALAALVGAAVILMSVGLYEVRKVMSSSTLGEIAWKLASAETYQGALARDPLNYHQFLVAACEHFPADHPYLNGATYIRLLVFYLPRRYFESLKPPDTHNTFARAVLGLETTDITIPPTMIGDGYINFWGVPGAVAIMLLNGVAFALASRRMREDALAFLIVGSGFARYALLALRGSPYEIVTLALSATTFLVLIGWATGLRYGRINRRIALLNRMALRRRAARFRPAAWGRAVGGASSGPGTG